MTTCSVKFDRVLIDGDILCHKAACVSEIREHSVVWPDGNSYLAFRKKADALEYIEDKEGYSIQITQEPLPMSFAKDCVVSIIQGIINELDCSNLTIYLSNSDSRNCFRRRAYPDYKANRKTLIKPINLPAIRQFLIEGYDAKVMDIVEADDGLGADQCMSKDHTVIASIDKDLLQIPGYHYNIDSKQLIKSSDPGKLWIQTRGKNKKDLKGYGFLWFAAQMLLGDTVDNIKGIKGVGPVKVFGLLGDLKDKSVHGILSVVMKEYRRVDRIQDFEINARLLWILRSDSQLEGNVLTSLSRILQQSTHTGSEESLEPTLVNEEENTDKK